MNPSTKRTTLRTLAITAGLGATLTLSGCNSAGEGLFTGAALGAATGLIIGSMNGEAGEGAAIGAVLGGLGGAVIGDQNKRNARNARDQRHYAREGHRSNQPRGNYGYGHNDPWWESDNWCD